MPKCSNEHVSALLDDHLDGENHSQLDALLADSEATATWQRYALIGHVVRDTVRTGQSLDISSQVAVAIAAETPSNAVINPQLGAGHAQSKAALRWLKPLSSVAIAASVAVVAVLSIQQPVLDNGAVTESMEPALVTNPLGGRNPVSFNTVVPDNGPSAAEVAQQRQLLQAYMLDHQRQLQLSLQAKQQDRSESTSASESEKPTND
ncbi:sigma-E factor negative regulatory protein [Pseudidiomarina aestuarii]|nr:RseA family anti-sigma factor [Pseudidiomarina aestuarii]